MDSLSAKLDRLDGKGYKAYKVLQGRYRFAGFELIIDHVQGDPFAEPSRIRLRVPAEHAAFPADSFTPEIRRIALEDYLCRRVSTVIRDQVKQHRGSGRSGEVKIAHCGQQVLVRDAVKVSERYVEARMGLALPAAGRRILAAEARAMLLDELPQIAQRALVYPRLDAATVKRHLDSIEDQHHLRHWLEQNDLVAFIGDDSRLARRSGIDDRPLLGQAVPFHSPPTLAVEPRLPHAGKIRGMGIPRGITLIVGGGFHGKSTLLQALQLGVYNHIPGDGRERVVCAPDAVKIRAEDGRSVSGVDISGFIDNLPLGRDTRAFCTDNASGSTSQATNIMEALACGAHTLLIDEDTSATNFMIRDLRMQQLVSPEREPITPLIDRVRELYTQHGVSTLLVTGGSSAYFDVADRVLMLDHYQASDATQAALRLAQPRPDSTPPRPLLSADSMARAVCRAPVTPHPSRPTKVQAYGLEQLRIGELTIELDRLEQLTETGQLLAIGHLIRHWSATVSTNAAPLPLLEQLRNLLQQAERQGLDWLSPYAPEPHGGLSLPRLYEFCAAVSRIRGLTIKVE